MNENFVDTFPRPPGYFQLFDKRTPPIPPIPVSATKVEDNIFEKIFSLPPIYPNEQLPHGREALKSALFQVMRDTLPLLTISTDQETTILENNGKLNDSLLRFYQCLENYRCHEAKENLIEKLKSELSIATDVECDLKRAIENCRERLKES